MLTAVKTVDSGDVSDTTFAYNDLGKLTDTWDKHFGATTAKRVTYAYDQAGLLTSTTYPDNTVVNRTSTWNGKIDTLSRSGSKLVDYVYIGQRVARRAYNTTTTVDTDYSYDNLGRITDITAGSLVDFHYDYVADENNIDKKRFDHRTETPYNQYSYDDIDRVTGITYHDSDTEAFYMDDLGNRSGNQTLRDDGTTNFTVDTATNRYTSIAGNTITHDNAGNLTTDKDGYQHEYDCENRIIKIKDSGNADVATFDYDALNRRIRKVDSKATETTLYYYSDKWQVLAEHNGTSFGNIYVYGNYIDEVLVMDNGTNDYFYLQDHLCSPVALLTDAGTVTERYEYDAYGKMAMLDPDFTAWSGIQAGNPYYFTGRRLDVLDEGKYEVMYYRNRYYDSNTGRFLQHDLLEYIDGLSLYQYVESSPVMYFDFLGKEKVIIGFEGLGGYNPDGRMGVVSLSLMYDEIRPELISAGGTFRYYAQNQLNAAYIYIINNHIQKKKQPDGSCKYDTLIIAGYSYGGSAAHHLAKLLLNKGIRVNAVVTVDPVPKIIEDGIGLFGFSKKPNVDDWYNFYQKVDEKTLFGLPVRGHKVNNADSETEFIKGSFSGDSYKYAHIKITEHPTVLSEIRCLVGRVPDWRDSNEY